MQNTADPDVPAAVQSCEPAPRFTTVLPVAAVWAALAALAAMAALPAVKEMIPEWYLKDAPSFAVLALLQMVQTGVMVLLLASVGLWLGRSVGLGSPVSSQALKDRRWPEIPRRGLALSIVSGVLAGMVILLVDLYAIAPRMPAPIRPLPMHLTWWKIPGAALYGGVVEELLMRLFLVTLFTWIVWRLLLGRRLPVPPVVYGLAIVAAALLFGAGHLMGAATVWPLTGLVIFRTILLNAIGGCVFGVLFCRHGIEHAMIAHFFAALVLLLLSGGGS